MYTQHSIDNTTERQALPDGPSTIERTNAMGNPRHLFLSLVLSCVSMAPVPALASEGETPRPDADGWYRLFNGKDLSGWKKSQENEDTFQVIDGEIVAKGPRCHLYYAGPVADANFKNFEWKCEILTKPQANSGMYFHTKYQSTGWPAKGLEVQINNTHPDSRKTGSLYRAKDIMHDSPAEDNQWFTQHVIVDGHKVTVKINDKIVNEFVEKDPPERERGWEGNVLSSGTFALQGHDPGSEVHFRKVLVKPLP